MVVWPRFTAELSSVGSFRGLVRAVLEGVPPRLQYRHVCFRQIFRELSGDSPLFGSILGTVFCYCIGIVDYRWAVVFSGSMVIQTDRYHCCQNSTSVTIERNQSFSDQLCWQEMWSSWYIPVIIRVFVWYIYYWIGTLRPCLSQYPCSISVLLNIIVMD